MVVFGHEGWYWGKLVVFRKSGCIRATSLYSGKVVVLGQKWLYSGKSGCISRKVVVSGQKWLFSVKSGCVGVKVVVFGQK